MTTPDPLRAALERLERDVDMRWYREVVDEGEGSLLTGYLLSPAEVIALAADTAPDHQAPTIPTKNKKLTKKRLGRVMCAALGHSFKQSIEEDPCTDCKEAARFMVKHL